jgi:type I site-specific restriction endonuclease
LDRNELRTRLDLIDVLLKEQGWIVSDRSRVQAEVDTRQSDFVAKQYKTPKVDTITSSATRSPNRALDGYLLRL